MLWLPKRVRSNPDGRILRLQQGFLLMPVGLYGAGFVAGTSWNPSDKGSNVTLSNSNLTASFGAAWPNNAVRAAMSKNAGKWYWQVKFDSQASGGGSPFIGIAGNGTFNVATNFMGATADSYCYEASGNKRNSSVSVAYGAAWTVGDVIGILWDATNGTLIFEKNGTQQGTAFTGISGTFFPAVSSNTASIVCQVTANFGSSAFAGSGAPAGYNPGVY